METGVRTFQQGIGDLVGSLMTGDRSAREAYERELTRLERADATRMQGRKYRLEGDVLQDQVNARPGLGDALGAVLGDAGRDPALGGHYATVYRAAGGNAGQLGDLVAQFANLGRQNDAIEGYEANPTRANVQLAASGRTPYTPHTQTAGGLAIDTGTGAQNQSSPAAQRTLGAIAALAAERTAAADVNNARAAFVRGPQTDAADALAGQRRGEFATTGAGGTGGAGGSGYGPSDANAMFRYTAELMGGRYDPMTGQFANLQPDLLTRLQAIAAEAERLYRESAGAIGHLEAVRQAGAAFGIRFPAPGGALSPPPPGGAPDASDPANIRDWLEGL